MTPEKILTFWFEEVKPEKKFTVDPEFDALVSEKFEEVYWEVLNGKTDSWRETPEGRLAEIIVLDQFARNMFRGTPQAFSGDALALELAENAIAAGADKELQEEQRMFVYLPYMHSESLDVHEKAMDIFKSLGNEEVLEYEIKHKKIIEEFGRYPHRNEALGRESTPAEIAWLEAGGGF